MEYRNYMVMELSSEPHDGLEEWMIACFPEYKTAKAFAEAFLPKTDVDRIEIWGTDEDPDTSTSCDTLYIRDMAKGSSIDFEEIGDEKAKRIKDIANKLADEEGDTPQEIIAQLASLDGCYGIIEYLIQIQDEILNR